MERKNPQNEQRTGNNLFMIQRKITFIEPMQLKILTKLSQNIPTNYRPKNDFVIAQITIYTDKRSYEGDLTGSCIPPQLAWNNESLCRLKQCLMDKRDNVQLRFYPIQMKQLNGFKPNKKNFVNIDGQGGDYYFQIVCQISSGINLSLFIVHMKAIQVQNPLAHMMQKFSRIQFDFRQKERDYKEKESKLKEELNQIEAIQKQIIDSANVQINVMKTNFVKIINQCKQQIRKLVDTIPTINPINGLIQNKNKEGMQKIRQERDEDQQSQKNQKKKNKNKVIKRVKKVDRNAYNIIKPQKMQLQQERFISQHNSSHQQDFIKNKYQVKSQPIGVKIQKVQKRSKFNNYQDQNSSQEEDSNYLLSENEFREPEKDGRTFLQIQQEQLEKQKLENKGSQENVANWEELFK